MNIWVDANGWPIPPVALLGCLVVEILYFRGQQVLVRGQQAKAAARALSPALFRGSASGEMERISWSWRGAFFLGAVVILLIAVSNPLDILSARFFWVHMVQHLLLLVVMTPLLVAGAPLLPLWLGLPRQLRRLAQSFFRLKIGRVFFHAGDWLRQPVFACALLIVGTWAWHWPPLYDLALTNSFAHVWGQHLTFLLASLPFWGIVISSPPLRPRLGYLGRLGCVGIGTIQNVVLAVVIGFAQQPLYAPYVHLVGLPGVFSALQDQQIGASIMWTFGDVPFGIALSILVQRWLAEQMDEPAVALEVQQGAKK